MMRRTFSALSIEWKAPFVMCGLLDDPNVRISSEQSRRPFMGKPVPIAKLVAAVREVAGG